MLFSGKRKNDDEKPKGRRSQLATVVFIIGINVLIMALMVVLLLTSGKPSNAFPTARLLYTSDNDQYSLNLQTGERTLMENRVTVDPRSALSPDGQWLVRWDLVTEYYEWTLTIYDGKTLRELKPMGTFLAFGTPLSWAPDSRWVAFSALPFEASRSNIQDNQEELWLIDSGTLDMKQLTNNTFRDSGPVFSPDGTQIAYTSAADGYNRLYVMDVATGESRLITPEMHGYRATWSPDGQWIAFMTTHLDYNGDIWIVRADGTGAQAITTGKTRDDDPIWQP